MLEWHDCKTDPPKEDGFYALSYHTEKGLKWVQAHWSVQYQRWMSFFEIYHEDAWYKWAEIELPE